jgi:hypothetical protein
VGAEAEGSSREHALASSGLPGHQPLSGSVSVFSTQGMEAVASFREKLRGTSLAPSDLKSCISLAWSVESQFPASCSHSCFTQVISPE